jgi:hypothetical protein
MNTIPFDRVLFYRHAVGTLHAGGLNQSDWVIASVHKPTYPP